jgi:hypothetical protein
MPVLQPARPTIHLERRRGASEVLDDTPEADRQVFKNAAMLKAWRLGGRCRLNPQLCLPSSLFEWLFRVCGGLQRCKEMCYLISAHSDEMNTGDVRLDQPPAQVVG